MQKDTTTDYTSYFTSALRYVARTAVDCIIATPKFVATFMVLPVMTDALRCFYGPALQHHYCMACSGCNGQGEKILTLLEAECGITHLDSFKVLGDLPHRDYGYLENSTTPACTLYLSPISPNQNFGPCVPDVMQRNVTSGLADECIGPGPVFITFGIVIGSVVTLGTLGYVLYRHCSHRFFQPALTPEDHERYNRISEKFSALMAAEDPPILMGPAANR